ncbi:MAG: hypothetical protein M3Q93_16055 [Gemmatimonadota bacterium]|nr:hypothetical protein [Gemmatimonadota bacterium]
MRDPRLDIGHPDAREVAVGAEEVHRPPEEELSHGDPVAGDLGDARFLLEMLGRVGG